MNGHRIDRIQTLLYKLNGHRIDRIQTTLYKLSFELFADPGVQALFRRQLVEADIRNRKTRVLGPTPEGRQPPISQYVRNPKSLKVTFRLRSQIDRMSSDFTQNSSSDRSNEPASE